jgi:uncharacterized protein YggE
MSRSPGPALGKSNVAGDANGQCMIARLALAVALVAASISVAQAQVIVPSTGITVTGRGAVRVKADEMRFTATLYASGTRGSAAASPQPAVDVDGAAEAVVKALRADGIADAATSFAGNFSAVNAQRTVLGTLQKPTRDKVNALLKDGSTAAAPFPGVALQNVSLGFLVDDCSGPEARAQEAALADARARAERIAHAGGLRLGAIMAVTEASTFNPNGACAIRPDTPAPLGNGRIDGDPTLTGEVFVSISATVTYAIVH